MWRDRPWIHMFFCLVLKPISSKRKNIEKEEIRYSHGLLGEDHEKSQTILHTNFDLAAYSPNCNADAFAINGICG